MPTYTKETALYDTGAIKNGIDGAAETASKYLTVISGTTGISVHDENDNKNFVNMNATNGVTIYRDIDGTATDVANFGEIARIGKSGGAHSIIDADGLRVYAGDGTRSLAHIGYGASGNNWWTYFTFGSRKSGTTPGPNSFAQGYDTTATANSSHAEGSLTSATGADSHAEGFWSSASKAYSHAEGRHTEANGEGAHAEGYYTQANGDYSHAQGNQTTADGDYSTAQGKGTTANEDCQTVVGMYNDTSITGVPLFVVGNGTESTPSNAFYVNAGGYAVSKSGFKVKGNSLLKTLRIWLVNKSIPAPANTSYIIDNTNFASDIPSGYTPIGIVGYGAQNSASSGVGASYVAFYRCILLNTNTVQWGFRNVAPTATAIKVDVYADVLLANTGII